MRIDVRLFATLRPYIKGIYDEGTMEFPPGTTVQHIITALKIPDGEVRLIFVNGKHETLEYVLSDGDRLGLFPPVGGG